MFSLHMVILLMLNSSTSLHTGMNSRYLLWICYTIEIEGKNGRSVWPSFTNWRIQKAFSNHQLFWTQEMLKGVKINLQQLLYCVMKEDFIVTTSFHKAIHFTMHLCIWMSSREEEEAAVPEMWLKWAAVMGTTSERTWKLKESKETWHR